MATIMLRWVALFALVVALGGAVAAQTVTLDASPLDGGSYELSCEDDFGADRFVFRFGDGDSDTSDSPLVDHEYAPGSYEVSCTAANTSGDVVATDSLTLSVPRSMETASGTNASVNRSDAVNVSFNASANATGADNGSVMNATRDNASVTGATGDNATRNRTGSSGDVVASRSGSLLGDGVSLTAQRLLAGEYRLRCEADGFEPQAYDWSFGDGTTAYDVQDASVTHTYALPGEKTVTCGAWAPGVYETATVSISVADVMPEADVVVLSDADPAFSFRCEAPFDAETYDWDFGDGTMRLDTRSQTAEYTYDRNGPYDVSCTAWDQETSDVAIGFTRIDVEGAPGSTVTGDITLLRERLADDSYRFTCVTPGMDPIAYDWEIYEVYGEDFRVQRHDVADRSITYDFDADGKYVVSCTATDEERTLIEWEFLTVQGAGTAYAVVQVTPENATVAPPTQVFVDDGYATLRLPADAQGDVWLAIESDEPQRLDLGALRSGSSATVPVVVTMASPSVAVRIPAGTTFTADDSWDGMVWLPHSAEAPQGAPDGVDYVVEVGSDAPLSFDRAVRLVFDGRAGQAVAVEHAGEVREVTMVCEQDTQSFADGLSEPCAVSVDGDLVVWTKSFSRFMTYESAEQTPTLTVSDQERSAQDALDRRSARTGQEFAPVAASEGVDVQRTAAPTDGSGWVWLAIILGVVVVIVLAVVAFARR